MTETFEIEKSQMLTIAQHQNIFVIVILTLKEKTSGWYIVYLGMALKHFVHLYVHIMIFAFASRYSRKKPAKIKHNMTKAQ